MDSVVILFQMAVVPALAIFQRLSGKIFHFLNDHKISIRAGADFVMAGGMFAGHDQSGGDVVEENGKKFKLFYGMSSATAMDVS